MSPALDACPGVLTLHPARDGLVARIRLPGGYASAARWRALARLSAEFGDGCVDLTARGNVQLRGLRAADAEALAARVAEAGLMPSAEHDRARNITASPLSGLCGRPALRALVDALDAALLAGPEFAALPGRFLFALDDGTGGASLASSDVGLCYTGPAPAGPVSASAASRGAALNGAALNGAAGGYFDLFVAGRRVGVRVPAAGAVAAVLAATRAALAVGVGASVTRIAALPDAGESVAAAVGGTLGAPAPPDTRLPLGSVPAAAPAAAATAPASPPPSAATPTRHTDPSRNAALGQSRTPRADFHDRGDFPPVFAGELPTIMEEPPDCGGAGQAGGVGGVVVAAARLGRLTGEQVEMIAGLVAPDEVVRVGVAGRLVIPLGAGLALGEAAAALSGGVGLTDGEAAAGMPVGAGPDRRRGPGPCRTGGGREHGRVCGAGAARGVRADREGG